ncbi:MAG: conjugal transfer protein TraS, partial [Hydrogenophaga sp.]|nr:conjugal transfer protein TraS [Hydrogenophaga sp.]
MTTGGPSIDGVLVQWGERLFYPPSRIVKPDTTPRLNTPKRPSAAAIRQRIAATVARRAPQVMIKVTGGGRGMGAIAAHFRYICKNGQLRMEDDRGVVREGKEAMHDLAEQWRVSGSLIPETSHRREAFNIMLSMPQGTDAQTVLKAARGFAKRELRDHHYVMVLHEHQANPHVHLSVKAESIDGKR